MRLSPQSVRTIALLLAAALASPGCSAACTGESHEDHTELHRPVRPPAEIVLKRADSGAQHRSDAAPSIIADDLDDEDGTSSPDAWLAWALPCPGVTVPPDSPSEPGRVHATPNLFPGGGVQHMRC